MELSKLKKYRRRHNFLRTLNADNPALLLGVDLPFVVATATSLKNAAAVSIQMLIIHLVTMLLARTLTIRMPLRFRAMANVAVSTLMMLISREIVILLFPGIMNSVGMYLYLMAVNGLTLVQANVKQGSKKLGQVMFRALIDVIAFALMMFAVSLVREVLGNATIWGVQVPLRFKMSGMQLPFFGFIFTGFILAFVRTFNKRIAAMRLSGAALQDAAYIDIDAVEDAGMPIPPPEDDLLRDIPINRLDTPVSTPEPSVEPAEDAKPPKPASPVWDPDELV